MAPRHPYLLYSHTFEKLQKLKMDAEKIHPKIKHPIEEVVLAWREFKGKKSTPTFAEFIKIEEFNDKATPEEIEKLLEGNEDSWRVELIKDKKRRIYHSLGVCLAADAILALTQRKRSKGFIARPRS